MNQIVIEDCGDGFSTLKRVDKLENLKNVWMLITFTQSFSTLKRVDKLENPKAKTLNRPIGQRFSTLKRVDKLENPSPIAGDVPLPIEFQYPQAGRQIGKP